MFKGPIGVLLYVNDVRRSVNFYRSLGFSFKGYWDFNHHRVTADWEGPGEPGYAEVTVGDVGVGLHAQDKSDGAKHDPASVSAAEHHLQIDDPDAFHRLLVAKGCKPTEPADMPWGWRMLSVNDPDGHRWNFYKPLVPAA